MPELGTAATKHRPATADDVAAYILQKCGPMTAMKLQKLLYYAQAWSLVWDEAPLFSEDVQAWANGPVVPSIYQQHRGRFDVGSWSGKPDSLAAEQRESVDAVLQVYAKLSAVQLSELTHRELPWLETRRGLGPGDRGEQVISHAAMAEYYSSLV